MKNDRIDPPATLAQVELEAIIAALRWAGGNVAKAAKVLGCDRKTLYRRFAVHPELKQAVRDLKWRDAA